MFIIFVVFWCLSNSKKQRQRTPVQQATQVKQTNKRRTWKVANTIATVPTAYKDSWNFAISAAPHPVMFPWIVPLWNKDWQIGP